VKWFMVLETGQFSELDGCAIVAIPDDTPDHLVDSIVVSSDAYYCFGAEPTELEPNNGQTLDDIRGNLPDYVNCIGCGRKFNLKVWWEDAAYTSHDCDSTDDELFKKATGES
jgi:hypothetical protein